MTSARGLVAIAPSVLSADFSKLREEADELKGMGAEWLHLDIMDGHFVDNLTFGHDLIKCLRPHTDAFFDVHLMVVDPAKFVDRLAEAGVDQILFHVESPGLDKTVAVLEKIRSHRCRHESRSDNNIRAGLVIKPSTELSDELISFIKENHRLIDVILPMTVEPGKSGQSFMSDQLDKKFKVLRDLRDDDLYFDLEADGGVKVANIEEVAAAGANIIVSGSGIMKLKGDDRRNAIQTMKAAVQAAQDRGFADQGEEKAACA